MRHATLLAAAIALAAAQPALAKTAPKAGARSAPAAAPAADPPVGAAPSGDPTVNDMRCMVVAAALVSSDDEQMKSLGRANLFYFMGRLDGRGDTANLDTRIVEQATKMTDDDLKTQSRSCGVTFTAAAQSLQSLSNAFQQHFGAPPAAGGGAVPPKK